MVNLNIGILLAVMVSSEDAPKFFSSDIWNLVVKSLRINRRKEDISQIFDKFHFDNMDVQHAQRSLLMCRENGVVCSLKAHILKGVGDMIMSNLLRNCLWIIPECLFLTNPARKKNLENQVSTLNYHPNLTWPANCQAFFFYQWC